MMLKWTEGDSFIDVYPDETDVGNCILIENVSRIMTNYKIHPIRFAGKIQSYVVTINGATFVQGKNAVIIFGDGYKRTINNSWYADIKTEEL